MHSLLLACAGILLIAAIDSALFLAGSFYNVGFDVLVLALLCTSIVLLSLLALLIVLHARKRAKQNAAPEYSVRIRTSDSYPRDGARRSRQARAKTRPLELEARPQTAAGARSSEPGRSALPEVVASAPNKPASPVRSTAGSTSPELGAAPAVSLEQHPGTSSLPAGAAEARRPSGGGPAGLSIPDLLQEIAEHGKRISTLIHAAQHRIDVLEAERAHPAVRYNEVVAAKLASARRIVAALEHRREKLRQFCVNPTSPAILRARALIEEKLVVPGDAVGGLIDADRLLQLEPKQWEPMLKRLLSSAQAELERSISQQAG